jgi:hypothetical protein
VLSEFRELLEEIGPELLVGDRLDGRECGLQLPLVVGADLGMRRKRQRAEDHHIHDAITNTKYSNVKYTTNL